MFDRNYWHPDYDSPISKDYLHKSESDFQKEVMREWFFQNYEDPAENTPYESSEGGYLYIWGGPYDAREALSDEFRELVPEELIENLADELEAQSPDWSGKPSAESFNDYSLSVISSNTEFHATLLEDLLEIEKLVDVDLDHSYQRFLLLLHVNIVTVLEVFLSDAFLNTAIKNQNYLRKFVERNSDFGKKKLKLNRIFERMEGLETEIRDYLLNIVWHNLAKIKPMYEDAFDIVFPADLIKPLFAAIAIRHHIVHRNGKTREGKEIELSRGDVRQLIGDVRRFAKYVDEQLRSSLVLAPIRI